MIPAQRVLLVIPAYREGKRLPRFLPELVAGLSNRAHKVDVLIVDDGSGPEEQAAVTKLVASISSDNPRLLPPALLPANLGKGAAIRHGWNTAAAANDYDRVAFADADGAVCASEIHRLITLATTLPAGTTVFASRVKMLGRRIERSFARHLSGRVFATLVGTLLCPQIYDSQCGCKLLPIEAWLRIRDHLQEDGFAFDVELLAALKHHHLPVIEAPVDWIDQPGSRVHLLRDSWRMFAAVLRIRRRFHP